MSAGHNGQIQCYGRSKSREETPDPFANEPARKNKFSAQIPVPPRQTGLESTLQMNFLDADTLDGHAQNSWPLRTRAVLFRPIALEGHGHIVALTFQKPFGVGSSRLES